MSKKLTTFVHVRDDDGAAHVFGPSDDVPTWAASRIRNPAVWDGYDPDADDDAAGEPEKPKRGPGRPRKAAEPGNSGPDQTEQ